MQSLLVDGNRFFEGAGQGVKNQYLIVGRHHRIPAVAFGESCGFRTAGQGDAVGHDRSIAIETGDKQSHDHYKPANHHHRQHRDQLTKKAQIGR